MFLKLKGYRFQLGKLKLRNEKTRRTSRSMALTTSAKSKRKTNNKSKGYGSKKDIKKTKSNRNYQFKVKNYAEMPVTLLLTHELSTSAKLVWAILYIDEQLEQRHRLSPSRLEQRTGLCRKTVRDAIESMQALGWYSPDPRVHLPKLAGHRVSIHAGLLVNTSLKAGSRLMYGWLQATTAYQTRSCQFTYVELSRELGLGLKSVRCWVKELVDADWLHTQQKNQVTAISLKLRNPIKERFTRMLERTLWRLEKGENIGEVLAQEICSVTFDDDDCSNNDEIQYLQVLETGGQMHFDRKYHSADVAIEFNGRQHDEPDEKYDAEAVRLQKERDERKRRICDDRGIRLIIIRPEELSFEAIIEKVGDLLPRRELYDCADANLNLLEWRSRGYRRKVMECTGK